MSTFKLTGQDVIKINSRLFTDFPSGDIAKVTFATDIVTVKTGKNGNAIYAANETGNQASLEIRVLRGSGDDTYLNSLLNQYRNQGPAFILMTGEIVKRMGDGLGNIISDTYILTGGIFTKLIEVTSNVEGDIEQAVSKYTMMFAFAPRAIS